MCIERWVQRFFSPFAPSWTAPVPPSSLDALDAAVLRRLRYLAACPLLVAAWSLAALVLGGVTAQRLGTLGAGVMQTAVLCATSVRAVGRTLAGAQHLTNFMTLFLVLVLSALPLTTYTTNTRCDALHTKMYDASAPRGSTNTRCALLLWDLFFTSLMVGGTITSLQVARRLETALLVQLLAGAHARDRDQDDAENGCKQSPQIGADGCAGLRPNTRRAAGLLAAPRAQVLRPGRPHARARDADPQPPSSCTHNNALFEVSPDADGEDGTDAVLRGVLINTGPPPELQRGRAAVPPPLSSSAPAVLAVTLPRKLTQ